MAQSIEARVYYGDTDAGGVVYHATYLHFLERSRTEFLRSHGIDVIEYHRKGLFLVITHIDISYKRPARLGDVIAISTEFVERTHATMTIRNRVIRDGELLVEALLTFACMGTDGRPKRLPEAFQQFS